MSEETEKVEGPARVVELGGDCRIEIFGIPCGPFLDSRFVAEKRKNALNRALDPLTRKADLCGRMKESILDLLDTAETHAMQTLDRSGVVMEKIRKARRLLAEFGREGV